jgi:hypothetical protein
MEQFHGFYLCVIDGSPVYCQLAYETISVIGAGAVVMKTTDTLSGILFFIFGSDDSGADLLILPAGGLAYPPSLETARGTCMASV